MTKKKMLIHAGVHQAGAASIQNMLANSASQLAACGILYAPFDAEPTAKVANHQRLAWGLIEKKLSHDELKAWAATLAQSEAGTIVLSAQDFCRLRDVSFLEDIAGNFDVEVVFYVRRQDEWVNSWYNMNIKWPLDAKLCRCDPIEFLNHLEEFHWIRYSDLADRWAKTLGPERVHIRVMERGQVEDPVADFCDLAGIKRDIDSHNPHAGLQEDALNANLPADQLELLRRLGTFGYPHAVRTKLLKAVRKAGGRIDSNVFPREIRELILFRFAAQNQQLATVYLKRSDGVLFRDTEFPASPPAPDIPDKRPIISFIRGIIDEFSPGARST